MKITNFCPAPVDLWAIDWLDANHRGVQILPVAALATVETDSGPAVRAIRDMDVVGARSILTERAEELSEIDGKRYVVQNAGVYLQLVEQESTAKLVPEPQYTVSGIRPMPRPGVNR